MAGEHEAGGSQGAGPILLPGCETVRRLSASPARARESLPPHPCAVKVLGDQEYMSLEFCIVSVTSHKIGLPRMLGELLTTMTLFNSSNCSRVSPEQGDVTLKYGSDPEDPSSFQ